MADGRSMSPDDALGEVMQGAHADVLREGVELVVSQIMEAEVAERGPEAAGADGPEAHRPGRAGAARERQERARSETPVSAQPTSSSSIQVANWSAAPEAGSPPQGGPVDVPLQLAGSSAIRRAAWPNRRGIHLERRGTPLVDGVGAAPAIG
jgi:hypothetical protein